MKKQLLNIIGIWIFIFLWVSCELVDSEIESDASVPTLNVRYVVTMTSSSSNSNPIIDYTNSNGGTTELNLLELDLTVPIDSGTTANLFASCTGYYSSVSRGSSAAVDIKIFVADSLIADSTNIQTQSTGTVTASAQISALIE